MKNKYTIKFSATCHAYEGGKFIERIKFYNIELEDSTCYEDWVKELKKYLAIFKEEWLNTKDDIKKDMKDYYYVLQATMSTFFLPQQIAWVEEKINDMEGSIE